MDNCKNTITIVKYITIWTIATLEWMELLISSWYYPPSTINNSWPLFPLYSHLQFPSITDYFESNLRYYNIHHNYFTMYLSKFYFHQFLLESNSSNQGFNLKRWMVSANETASQFSMNCLFIRNLRFSFILLQKY